MGCDIHLHIEVKIKGEWHHYGAPKVNRNYALFGKMAGVRDEEQTPISKPKGLPKDVTFLTKLNAKHWKSDGHTHSWLGVDEISQLEEWYDKEYRKFDGKVGFEWNVLNTYLFGNSFTGWKKYPDENYHGIEDVRFVFWFDN